MKNSEYKALHDLPKKTKSTHLLCVANGQQANYDGFALLEPSNTFKVIQNRKGHRRTNCLSYMLFHHKSEKMVRIDLKGKPHEGVATPHVHIFDDQHQNGQHAIPLTNLVNYNCTDEIVTSLMEFLKYNNFEISDITIEQPLI